MLRKVVSLWLLLLAPFAARAGNDAGNGGHGVICARTGGTELASVKLFDLWYAKRELQLEIIESTEEARALGRRMVMRLFEANREYFGNLLVSYADVSRAQVRLAEDLNLLPPRAYLGNIVPAEESGCQILPLAVYADTGVLLTKGRYWDFMGSAANPQANVQVAAFYLHEAVGDMLRKRERAKLGQGETLSEETRKRIAKETVHVTALAFTKMSDKALLRRLNKYWATGEVYEKPKLERFEIRHKVWGGVFDSSAPAWNDAKEKCEAWKKATETRLKPVTEFLIITCGNASAETEGPWAGANSKMRGTAIATITLVPNRPVVKFADHIHSELFPEQDSSLPTAALGSYLERAAAWRTDQERRLQDKVFLLNEGPYVESMTIDRTWMWRQHFAGEWRSGIVGVDYPRNDAFAGFAGRFDLKRKVGQYLHSPAEVYLFVDAPALVKNPDQHLGYRVESTKYQFQAPGNEAMEKAAAAAAMKSFDASCARWLDDRYHDGAVFASCASRGYEYKVDARDSVSYFQGSGEAFHPED